MVLFALLLQQCNLETHKDGAVSFAVHSVHLHGCCCLQYFKGKKKLLEISSMLFSASRGAGQLFLLLAM